MNLKDIFEALRYPGFIKLLFKNWTTGTKELLKTFSKNIFLRELRKFLSKVKKDELLKGVQE